MAATAAEHLQFQLLDSHFTGIRHLVLSYLVYNCYEETALSFARAISYGYNSTERDTGTTTGQNVWNFLPGKQPEAVLKANTNTTPTPQVDNEGDVEMEPVTERQSSKDRFSTETDIIKSATIKKAVKEAKNPLEDPVILEMIRTLSLRKDIMKLIRSGEIEAAVDKITSSFSRVVVQTGSPEFKRFAAEASEKKSGGAALSGGDLYTRVIQPAVDPLSISFQLHCQQFIELVRAEKAADALSFAQEHLGRFGEARELFLDALRDVVALLAYQKPSESPVAHFMSQEHRDKLAENVNRAILGQMQVVWKRLQEFPFFKNRLELADIDPVSPSCISASEFIKLIHEVILYIDENNQQSFNKTVDLANEQPQETADRFVSFLSILKFNEPGLSEAISQGDRTKMASALSFLLSNEEANKKRAYLAPFMTPIQIPPQFAGDESVLRLNEQVTALQEEFKIAHQNYEQVSAAHQQVVEMKKSIIKLEDEKKQLIKRVEKLRKTVEQMPNSSSLLKDAAAIRRKLNMETELTEKLKVTQQEIATVDEDVTKKQQELKELRANIAIGPEAILAKLRENKQMMENALNSKLREEVLLLDKHIGIAQNLLSQTVTEILASTQMEEMMKQRLDEVSVNKLKSDPADDRIHLFRQQASLVATKKQAAADKLAALLQEQKRLDEEAVARGRQPGSLKEGEAKNQHQTLVEEDAELQKQLEAALSQLKELQERMKFLSSPEYEQLLRAKDQQTAVNEAKKLLQTLKSQAQAKKNELAPKLQRLRQLKEKEHEMEMKHSEQKRIYDAFATAAETEAIALTNNLRQLDQEVEQLEKQSIISELAAQHAVVAKEKQIKTYRGGAEAEQIQQRRGFKTYRDLYAKKINEAEQEYAFLKGAQKEAQDNYAAKVKQTNAILWLTKVFELKQKHLVYSMDAIAKNKNAKKDHLIL